MRERARINRLMRRHRLRRDAVLLEVAAAMGLIAIASMLFLKGLYWWMLLPGAAFVVLILWLARQRRPNPLPPKEVTKPGPTGE